MTGADEHVQDAERPVVAIYREMLLNFNEPYIRTQAEALARYRSFYVGASRVAGGLALPRDRTFVLGDGYRAVDRVLDRALTRLPSRGPLRELARGGVVARAGSTAFFKYGVSPRFERALRAVRPVLLHAHTGVSGAHVLPLARRLDLPFVVTFHGYDATASDEELARWPNRGQVYLQRRAAMQRDVTRMIAVSAYIRDLLVARGWPAERLTVHHMGVDTTIFAPAPDATPLTERAPVVFFAGRLIEKKGLEYLIDALRLVRATVPGAELVVAGTGPRQGALAKRAAAAGVPVRFLGRTPPEEVRAWMARAALYCMPSVRAADGDAEGLPTALVEAMACGLPVVATVHAGTPEAVVHGETGLLAAERDVAGLAAHLTALLGDGALRTRMGAAARTRVLAHFDHRRQAAVLEEIYDEVRATAVANAGRGCG